MKKYILVYGGTELTEPVAAFVEDLCYHLLSLRNIKLVTGGFVSRTGAEKAVSTDSSVLNGARRYAHVHKRKLKDLIEAWLPDPGKDRITEGVKRFDKKTGVAFKILKQKSPQARRFAMVSNVDAILTIKGKKHTAMVLDLAFAINKPTLPLPFAGGDSKDYWNENESLIKLRFDIGKDFAGQLKKTKLETLSPANKDKLRDTIVSSVAEAIERRCLILMDFSARTDKFYAKTIKPAVLKAGYKPIRIDKEANEGNIFMTYQQRLKDCDAIIADITEANPNVMYELGHAHAQGYSTILLCRKKLNDRSWKKLPFYLTMDTIEHGNATSKEGKKQLYESIVRHLEEKRKSQVQTRE